MLKATSGSVSITGNFRENNEDRLYVDPQGRFFLVADGMGGQAAGEKASELAVEIIGRKLESSIDFGSDATEKVTATIDRAVEDANAEIMALGEVDPSYHKMGTTIVFLLRVGERVFVGGVGDSRVYRLRNGSLEQLTTDHTLTQALIDAGTISKEEAATNRFRNMLWRYLGTKEGSTGTGAKELEPQPGDRFLLCSDGVSDGIEGEELAAELARHTDPQRAAAAIVAAAQKGGSRDNITAVVVDFA